MKIGRSPTTDLFIVEGDITRSGMDAIVNAANEDLAGGGGVDGAIHAAAGERELYRAAQTAKAERGWKKVPTGESVITPGFNLAKRGTRYVIHTVGPIQYVHGDQALPLLENCLRTSLGLAEQQGDIRSIAYPLISTGIFSVPVATFAYAAQNVLPGYDFRSINHVALYVFPGSRTQQETIPTLRRILGVR
ncbi:macro domain-containing protein [Candidatus Woesearchaeota archaeon]|nr:macro domain-containing protein [Candidatus Woesearchaeota archaeon]